MVDFLSKFCDEIKCVFESKISNHQMFNRHNLNKTKMDKTIEKNEMKPCSQSRCLLLQLRKWRWLLADLSTSCQCYTVCLSGTQAIRVFGVILSQMCLYTASILFVLIVKTIFARGKFDLFKICFFLCIRTRFKRSDYMNNLRHPLSRLPSPDYLVVGAAL